MFRSSRKKVWRQLTVKLEEMKLPRVRKTAGGRGVCHGEA